MSMPATLLACSCISEVPNKRPRSSIPSAPWGSTDRERVFVGHVLAIDTTRGQPFRKEVRFVTEMSWRGALPDTLTLVVTPEAPCAYYNVGGRFIVLADALADSKSAAITAPCDYSWSFTHGGRLRAELGPPNWTAPPMGNRSLDVIAIPLGRLLGEIPPSVDTLTFVAPFEAGMSSFEIGNWVFPTRLPRSRIFDLAPGLYQFRIRWQDGTVYESYLSLTCDRVISDKRCETYRFFGGLR